jgi:hypothetical protein
MKRTCLFAVVVAVATSFAACGGTSEQQKAAEELEKSAETIEKNADSMSKGAEDTARSMEAMARGLAGDSGVKPVDPVSFKDLQTVMPDVAGWEKASPTGERMTSPFSFSQALVTYKKGDAEIEQMIMDSGFNQLLFTPFTMLMAAGYDKETPEGFERSVNVAGNPGWEKWDKGSRNGELAIVVGKRYLVQLEGRGIDDVKTLHTVLEQTDLAKLAALK